MKIYFINIIILAVLHSASWASTLTNAQYEICFTPGQQCTKLITDNINAANHSIFLQAYSFTSSPIAKAIVDAKNRGVEVKVLLDKSQVNNSRYSSSTYLQNNGVSVYVDHKPAIAHNKIIIIDEKTTITGSFNFTKAAEYRNAENVIIITDKVVAQKYLHNWNYRYRQSMAVLSYLGKRATVQHH